MTKDEYISYFKSIIADYSDSSLSTYFPEDIKQIQELAESGGKAKNNKDREEIYIKLQGLTQTFNNKIDASLAQVVENFRGQGATSNLGGAFYFLSAKQGGGSELEDKIVAHANKGQQAKTFKEKSENFVSAMETFAEYVNKSDLATLINEADKQNVDASKLSLKHVYSNSLRVEKTLGYRTNQHVRDAFDKNPTNSHKSAMPFKYYTTLAGIKLGKIDKVTPQLIDDFRWFKKGAPHLLPKGLDPEDPALANDLEAQKKFLETLSNQYSEDALKAKLMESRTNFLNDEVVRIANIETTGAFKRGRMTVGSWAAMTGFFVGGIYAISAAVFGLSGLGNGLETNFLLAAAQNLANPLNLAVYSLLPTGPNLGMGLSSRNKARAFKEKYNTLSLEDKKQLFNDIKQVMEIKDKTQRKQKLEALNKKYDGVLGDKKRDMEANFNILARSMLAFESQLNRKVIKPLNRKAGQENKTEITIRNKGNILNFAKRIGISIDSPFYEVIENMVSKVKGYERGQVSQLAYKTVTFKKGSEVTDKTSIQTQPEQPAPVVVKQVDTSATIVSETEVSLNKAIDTVKEKIVDSMVKSKTISLDELGYEIEIVKTGITSRIKNLDSQLSKLLPRIRSAINDGEEEEFIIQNEKEKRKFSIGKIQVGKNIQAGADTVVVNVKKKKSQK